MTRSRLKIPSVRADLRTVATDAARRHSWTARPWPARGVRLLVYALPIALSLGFVHIVTSFLDAPTSSLWAFLVWWSLVSLGATVVVSLVYALSRRLLPLGVLLELSLVFPDQAPSRFQVALGTGTVESLEERVRLLRDAKRAPTAQEAAEILIRLVRELSVHDHVTRGHAERVRAYSGLLGRQLGLASAELDRLNWAALLHDIGKLEVDAEILNKPGKPTDDEWEALRRHPLYGETLVEPLREWLGEWMDAVGQHHERWDGAGYPRGLAGEQISRAGRIVAIADVFDVMTSARSYKEAASPAAARSELVRCSGTQFDARFVRAFVDVSLSRMRLVMGPFAWLSHAPLLARIPLSPSVGAALGGVAAVATTTATVMAGSAGTPQAAVLPDRADRPVTAAVPRSRPRLAVDTGPAETAKAPWKPPAPRRQPGLDETGRPEAPDLPSPTPEAPAPGPRPSDPPGPPPRGDPKPAPPGDPRSPRPPDPAEPQGPMPPQAPPPGPSVPPAPPPSPPPSPNQAPSFVAGPSQSVLEDAGPQSVSGWASSVSPGPPSESEQNVSFSVSTDRPDLFAAQPSVSADGTLSHTPAANANGVATVTVTARDNGGTANGGVDSSAAASFNVTLVAVNDAPTFAKGPNQTCISLLGTQSVSGWATGISPGPANESSQSVTFVVTTSAPGLFATQPAVASDGTLAYRPKPLALGIATVTVRAVDTGGTANGGVDTSADQTFVITIL